MTGLLVGLTSAAVQVATVYLITRDPHIAVLLWVFLGEIGLTCAIDTAISARRKRRTR